MEKNVMRSMELVARERMEVAVSGEFSLLPKIELRAPNLGIIPRCFGSQLT